MVARSATSLAKSRPCLSASGQIVTCLPVSGDQSACAAALAPFGDVTTTNSGKIRRAASAAFSPSVTSTGASARAASSSSPYSGLGAGTDLARHSVRPSAALQNVQGQNLLRSSGAEARGEPHKRAVCRRHCDSNMLLTLLQEAVVGTSSGTGITASSRLRCAFPLNQYARL